MTDTNSRFVNTEFRDKELDELEFVKRRLGFRTYTEIIRECVRRIADYLRNLDEEEDD